MAILVRFATVALSLLLTVTALAETRPKQIRDSTAEPLAEAAIVALIIAGSIAAYKALGKPCACPDDRKSNGHKCGGSSARSRAGGYKPLCYTSDVTAPMIEAYRRSKTIPNLK